jgi:arylformamidase
VTPAPLVYGAYTQNELDDQYDTALTARIDVATYLQRFAAQSEAARADFARTTFAYGSHPRERLDFFAAPEPGAPLFVWIHGGYWRRLSKDDSSFIVPPLVRAGVAVAIPSYPLAPEASLDGIVASVRSAYAAAVAYGREARTDPERVFVGGHSVGAQLAGMLATAYEPRGVFALSGLYDLEPVRLSKINETIAMDAEQARRYSPIFNVPSRPATLLLAAGAHEQDEFHRQQHAYARAWRAARELEAPNHDHFSIVLALADERTALSHALCELVRND